MFKKLLFQRQGTLFVLANIYIGVFTALTLMTKRFVKVLTGLGVALSFVLPLVSAAGEEIAASIKEAIGTVFGLLKGVGGGLFEFGKDSGNVTLFLTMSVGIISFIFLYYALRRDTVEEYVGGERGAMIISIIGAAATIFIIPQEFYITLTGYIFTKGSDFNSSQGLIPLALGFGLPGLVYWAGSKWFSGESRLRGLYYLILAGVLKFGRAFVENGLAPFGGDKNIWLKFIPQAFDIMAVVVGIMGIFYLFRMFSGVAPDVSERLRENIGGRVTELARTEQQRADLLGVDAPLQTLETEIRRLVTVGSAGLARPNPDTVTVTVRRESLSNWLRDVATATRVTARPPFRTLQRLFKSGKLSRSGRTIIPATESIDADLLLIQRLAVGATNSWWQNLPADRTATLNRLQTNIDNIIRDVQRAIVVAEEENQRAQRRNARAGAGVGTAGAGTGGAP